MLDSYRIGLLFIVIVALIWAVSSVVTQYIFFDLSFPSPFLFTMVTNSLFVVYLPIYECRLHYDPKLADKYDRQSIQEFKRKLFSIALNISPFWFIANCLYNYSLLYTSVSSSTIIRLYTLFIRGLSNVYLQQSLRGLHFDICQASEPGADYHWQGTCHICIIHRRDHGRSARREFRCIRDLRRRCPCSRSLSLLRSLHGHPSYAGE